MKGYYFNSNIKLKMDNRNHNEKLQMLVTEMFEEVEIDNGLKLRYAISNLGRLVSFKDDIEFGRILKGSITEGYRIFRYKIRHGNKIFYRHRFFHRLVAENFIKKTSDDQTYVLHLDHNLSNDLVSNLKWATREEMLQHQHTNPTVQKARKKSGKRLIKYSKNRDGYKLTIAKVIQIKTLLANPERKMPIKTLAKKFGISETHLFRIKTGKNWGHVEVNGQNALPITGGLAQRRQYARRKGSAKMKGSSPHKW